jgi:hypothetical protein
MRKKTPPEPHDEAAYSMARLAPERQASRLLWFRERGYRNIGRLAQLEELPLQLVEQLLARAISTLVARGYGREWICQTFALTDGQLAAAVEAPPFGAEFEPITLEWPPPPPPPVVLVEVITDGQLISELSKLLQAEPECKRAEPAVVEQRTQAGGRAAVTAGRVRRGRPVRPAECATQCSRASQ